MSIYDVATYFTSLVHMIFWCIITGSSVIDRPDFGINQVLRHDIGSSNMLHKNVSDKMCQGPSAQRSLSGVDF